MIMLEWGGDIVIFFFFFQAEDGIRDKLVTGVQTCALPIFAERIRGQHSRAGLRATQGADGQLRQGGRNHVRVLAVLQEARARRKQPRRGGGGGRRGQARRVPVRREPLHRLLGASSCSRLNDTRSRPTSASTAVTSTAATASCC